MFCPFFPHTEKSRSHWRSEGTAETHSKRLIDEFLRSFLFRFGEVVQSLGWGVVILGADQYCSCMVSEVGERQPGLYIF